MPAQAFGRIAPFFELSQVMSTKNLAARFGLIAITYKKQGAKTLDSALT